MSEKITKRRRQLLPWWMKVFIWIFLIFGAFVPVAIVIGLLGYPLDISLYGLSTTDPFSLIGIILVTSFAYKAIVAFFLWTEKDQAILLAQIDGYIGVGICVYSMFFINLVEANTLKLEFRLELIFIILYLIKLWKIKPQWFENYTNIDSFGQEIDDGNFESKDEPISPSESASQ